MGLHDKKPRGKKGEGRATIFKPVNLPVDVAEDLKLLKNLYEVACAEQNDQWAKKARASMPKTYPVDPTEGEVWDMKYFFTNEDGDEVEAIPDKSGTFVAMMDGFKATTESMLLNEWTLINEAGIEITPEQARKVVSRILSHLNS